MNRSAGQTNRVNREAVLGRFVVLNLRYDSFPMNPEKRHSLHSLYLQCVQKDSFLNTPRKVINTKFPQ